MMKTVFDIVLVFGILFLVKFCWADNGTPGNPGNVDMSHGPPPQQRMSNDLPPAAAASSRSAVRIEDEPSLGLHGITEQKLNLKYYNFICASHYHLDCKITETLQVCINDNYVAISGLPLIFDKGSSDIKMLSKWMRTCDRNDQDMNQQAMKVIRKRIHYQNENDWKNVFSAASTISIVTSFIWIMTSYLML